MNITQLEKEILKAIKIEGEEIDFMCNADGEKTKHLKSLENFVKELFNKHRKG